MHPLRTIQGLLYRMWTAFAEVPTTDLARRTGR